MRRQLPWVALAGALLVALAALGTAAAAVRTFTDARDARANAQRLYDARRAVAAAQEDLGGGNIEDALVSAREANDTALQVGRLTSRIVALLRPTSQRAEGTIMSARRGSANTVLARRQAEIAAEALAAVASYQEAASRHSHSTNQALRRILRALRQTNRDFPGRPVP